MTELRMLHFVDNVFFQYVYQIKLNGELKHEVHNTQAESFEKVTVYFGDPWYASLDGTIRKLKIVRRA